MILGESLEDWKWIAMSQPHNGYKWNVLKCSQKGASHIRQSLKNQDWVDSKELSDGSIILAVADGHGSSESFRSDVGSELAVKTALHVCSDFLKDIVGDDVSTVKKSAEQWIPPQIIEEWKKRVAEHCGQNRFTEDELQRLSEKAGPKAAERVRSGKRNAIAYGSTLLAAMVTNKFLLCFQLGDGEILAVFDNTRDVTWIIPKDESLIANETTSLCQEDAAMKHFRWHFGSFQDSLPSLILVTTDGYVNSFSSADGFRKTAIDYLDLIRDVGSDEVKRQLPEWLEQTSREGSGDDITVGIICRRSWPSRAPSNEPKSAETLETTTSTVTKVDGTSNDCQSVELIRPQALPENDSERQAAPLATAVEGVETLDKPTAKQEVGDPLSSKEPQSPGAAALETVSTSTQDQQQ